MNRRIKKVGIKALILILFIVFVISIPKIFVWTAQYSQMRTALKLNESFPVTVDPKLKLITEDDLVNSYLATNYSLLGASVLDAGTYIWTKLSEIVIDIANAAWYQNLASVAGRTVTIKPGLRKEQVATLFGDILSWNSQQRKAFMNETGTISEGSFTPGIYNVAVGMSPEEVRKIVNDQFIEDILSHYGTSTQAAVPLRDALIIASLIQKETITTDGMRLLSGIIWNRLFADMNLQIDSTLQYAKANTTSEGSWWPKVVPKDKYIKSPFNTYAHKDLPPSPIASPSVAAVLAALNPIKTPCMYYFNDKEGNFHCSVTYNEHVNQLEKYY
jgi:UPF0755 protein